jgi:hypothetical protein
MLSFMQDPAKAVADGAMRQLAFLGAAAGLCGGASTDESKNSPTLSKLTDTLSVASGLMNRWQAEDSGQSPVRMVAEAIAVAQQLARMIPRPPLKEHSSSSDSTAVSTKFHEFLSFLVERVKKVKPGGFLIVPAAWLRSHVSAERPDENDDGGWAVMLLLVRDKSKDEWSVAIMNTGEGAQYHPVGAWGSAPSPNIPARQNPFVVCDVPLKKLYSSAFWYLLFRQCACPAASNGPMTTYGTLLPFLNSRPLSTNIGKEPKDWLSREPLPAGGDRSFAVR